MFEHMRKRFVGITIICLVLVSSQGWTANTQGTENWKPIKNVILLVGDGMGISHTTLTRWYKGGAPLAMDEYVCGLVRTYNSDTPIADSAPAATAYATGFKSIGGYISVMPDKAVMWGLDSNIHSDPDNRPLVTILEAARLEGKATGLVVTCEIPHATPAAFSAHVIERDNYNDILEQQVYNNIDVVFGGGYKYLQPGERKDKENLEQVLKSLGYSIVRTREEMEKLDAPRAWGLFAPKDISYDFDRSAEEPSLEQMTRKALELLDDNPNGFFLMVEGSKIDWASHANDPIGVISELLSFEKAVKVALDFAKNREDTVVISVADHSNGGLSFGHRDISSKYDRVPLEEFIEPLKKAQLTAEGTEKKLLDEAAQSRTVDLSVISTYYGIELNPAQAEEVKKYIEAKLGAASNGKYSLSYIISPIMSQAAHIGWTTNGHTGEEVALCVYHPGGYRPTGVVQNTDVNRYMADILGLNMDRWNQLLYIPVKKAFEGTNIATRIDETDPKNPVLIASRGKNVLKIPANKNIVELNGTKIVLKTVVVHNGKGFFIPRELVDLLK